METKTIDETLIEIQKGIAGFPKIVSDAMEGAGKQNINELMTLFDNKCKGIVDQINNLDARVKKLESRP